MDLLWVYLFFHFHIMASDKCVSILFKCIKQQLVYKTLRVRIFQLFIFCIINIIDWYNSIILHY